MMKYKISVIIIIFIILLYNLVIFSKIYKYSIDEPNYDLCHNTKKYDIALLDNNIENIKSGDLILYSAYSYDPYVRIFSDKVFSHFGIVVKINNIYYILELLDQYPLNNKLYKNKSLFPLYDRISKYSGNCFISRIKNPLNNHQLNLLIQLVNEDITFLSPVQLYVSVINNLTFSNRSTCSWYIYNILKKN